MSSQILTKYRHEVIPFLRFLQSGAITEAKLTDWGWRNCGSRSVWQIFYACTEAGLVVKNEEAYSVTNKGRAYLDSDI